MADKIRISPLFVRYCPIAMLDMFGLTFSMSTYNSTDVKYKIYATVYEGGKRLVDKPCQLGTLKPKSMLQVREQDMLKEMKFEPSKASKLVLIHLVPEAFQADCDSYSTMIEIDKDLFNYHG